MTKPNGNPTDRVSNSSNSVGRRRFLKATGAGALATAFAGCTGDGGGDGGGGGNGDGDGGSGGGTTGTAIEGPIKLGVQAPLLNIALGRSFEQAAKVIKKQLNDEGGLLGAEIELVIQDNEYNASKSREKYRELIHDHDVDAVFGTLLPESVNSFGDEIANNDHIYGASFAAALEFSNRVHENPEKFGNIFRSTQSGVTQGWNLAKIHEKLAKEEDISSVALLQEDISGYAANGRVFRENIPDGVTVEVDEKFTAGTQDYRPLLNKAANADVDFVWMWTSQTGATMINQWSRIQPDYGLGGISIGATDPSFGKNVEGSEWFLGMIPGNVATYRPTEQTESFIEMHTEMFDELPPFYSGYTTYDAMLSWSQSVREAGTLETDAIISILEEREFTGTQGILDYLPPEEDVDTDDPQLPHDPRYGDDYVIPPGFQWKTVDDTSTQAIIWPDKHADSQYEWPSWIDR